MEKLFTVKEVADYLQFTTRAVYNNINSGKLKSVKLASGSVRIKASDLLEFVERGKQ